MCIQTNTTQYTLARTQKKCTFHAYRAHWTQKTFDILHNSDVFSYICWMASHFTSFHFAVKHVDLYESATIIFPMHISNTTATAVVCTYAIWMGENWVCGRIIKKRTHAHTHSQSEWRKYPFDVWFFLSYFIVVPHSYHKMYTPKTHIHTITHCLRLFIYSFRFHLMLLSLFVCNFPCSKSLFNRILLGWKASSSVQWSAQERMQKKNSTAKAPRMAHFRLWPCVGACTKCHES